MISPLFVLFVLLVMLNKSGFEQICTFFINPKPQIRIFSKEQFQQQTTVILLDHILRANKLTQILLQPVYRRSIFTNSSSFGFAVKFGVPPVKTTQNTCSDHKCGYKTKETFYNFIRSERVLSLFRH